MAKKKPITVSPKGYLLGIGAACKDLDVSRQHLNQWYRGLRPSGNLDEKVPLEYPELIELRRKYLESATQH